MADYLDDMMINPDAVPYIVLVDFGSPSGKAVLSALPKEIPLFIKKPVHGENK